METSNKLIKKIPISSWKRIKTLAIESDLTIGLVIACLVDNFDSSSAPDGEAIRRIYEKINK